jgi:hypothetical protein
MCEVEFKMGNKKDFTAFQIQHTLNSLLKESFNHKLEESEMELALAALAAGIEDLDLKNGKQS